jgi:type I restriction enzyme S subunit
LIDERITTQNKILLHYQSLIQKLRNDIFIKKIRFKDKYGKPFCNWQNKRLKDIAKIFDGTHQTPTYVESGIPFYSVENVTGNNFKDTKFISEEIFQKESNRVIIEKGDILMTRIGDIGTIRLIDWDVCASFYVSLALIKKHQEYNSGYLAHYLATQIFQKELWDRTIHVAFPKKINLGEIGECLVLLPCMEEQNKIASVLSSISTKIDIEAQLLQKLEEQKKFLLQNLFV